MSNIRKCFGNWSVTKTWTNNFWMDSYFPNNLYHQSWWCHHQFGSISQAGRWWHVPEHDFRTGIHNLTAKNWILPMNQRDNIIDFQYFTIFAVCQTVRANLFKLLIDTILHVSPIFIVTTVRLFFTFISAGCSAVALHHTRRSWITVKNVLKI